MTEVDARTPHERRAAAVAALHEAVAPAAAGYVITMTGPEIAARIRKLAPLSKAPRWALAVQAWAAAVEDAQQPGLAYLQHSVHFGYAVQGL